MDGAPGLGAGLAGGFVAQALAQTPTPDASRPHRIADADGHARPSGAPKILLAFDASGSMLTDDGNGTPKIDAAKEAAVALLSTLPDSTRARAARSTAARCRRGRSSKACKDSSLVLPHRPGGPRRRRGRRSAASRRAGARRSRTRSQEAAKDLGRQRPAARSCSSPTARTPASRRRRATVAQEISKGGVVLRIQAIGFNVDQDAQARARVHRQRRRRRVPRRRGRGVAAAGAARPVHAHAAPVRHQGRADQGRRDGRARPRWSSPAATWTSSTAGLRSAGTRSTSHAGRR